MGPGGPKLDKLRGKMRDSSLDGLIVNSEANWRYLSGFRGDSGALLITPQEAFIFTDSRYIEEAREEASGFVPIMTELERDRIKEVILEQGLKKLGFEKDHVTYSNYEKFRERFSGVDLVGVSGWVEELRMVKTEEEVDFIRKAQEIADYALELLKRSIRVGVTEREIALEFEFTIRKMGADGLSFPLIAVSGPRSSLPHGVPTDRKLAPGDFLTLDFGAKYKGYCSDCTRTFIIGHADSKHQEVYNVVLEAQLAGLEAIRPGILAKEVDLRGRRVIEEAGYGEYFGHGIGHGVGLNIHEGPGVGRRSETVLEPGMVITVEPGIYIPGFGGCRIEDLVLVTENGKEILSNSPKELTVI